MNRYMDQELYEELLDLRKRIEVFTKYSHESYELGYDCGLDEGYEKGYSKGMQAGLFNQGEP